ncbi:hypothetical protein CMV_011581 [Castanea mollissima]|uniref:Uncharacterized protein n=1 Tax=Castanea mollissima TaxID=60419 RepID=A0A8J4VKM8_9ROSI|nr:hypothetical protein CMV_011581 [Castanea mollissima]
MIASAYSHALPCPYGLYVDTEVLIRLPDFPTISERLQLQVVYKIRCVWEKSTIFIVARLSTQIVFSPLSISNSSSNGQHIPRVYEELGGFGGSHKSRTSSESVLSELDKHFTHHIDKWIDFAISKRVKRLELDFMPLMTMNQCYTFTQAVYKDYKFYWRFPDIPHSNVCQFEVLTQIKSIEIYAPNLEYFGFVGSRIELSVNYGPRLLDVLVGGIYFSPMSYLFCPLSSYLSQLQCLKLDICHCNYFVIFRSELEFPELK